jgi:hypothetical protein
MTDAFNANCPGSLFWQGSLLELIQEQNRKLLAEVDSYDRNSLLHSNLEEVAQSFAEKYTLGPVKLCREQTEIIAHGQTTISQGKRNCLVLYDPSVGQHSAATYYKFAVPFDGDSRLFINRPSEVEMELPWGDVVGSEVYVLCQTTSRDKQAIRSLVDDNLNRVERWLFRANKEVEPFNAGLKGTALDRLQKRKHKLLQDNSLAESLGFPLRRREDAGATYSAPVVPKKLPIRTPANAVGRLTPEPVLEMEHYEHILGVISNMVLVMERSPRSFSRLDEEALRTHILVQLNGHYEGQATGETFNAEGKTDILIRVDGKNIFIAECKFWKGAEVFKETIDQLLGYASWRDTKTAIIVFNRNKDTSAVVSQIPSLVKEHPNFKHEVAGYKNETSSWFVLHHLNDKSRDLTLTVLLFDVPL